MMPAVGLEVVRLVLQEPELLGAYPEALPPAAAVRI
jgi:hypothetical protein